MKKEIFELSMDVECELTGLPEATCAHCRGDDDDPALLRGVIDADVERFTRIFEAQFPGVCCIDHSHKIKRGDKVSKVRYVDNPLVVIQGVACSNCSLNIERAK